MKCIKTTEAVGHVLCHDITQIIPGEYKGPVFKKGHVVREEDIPVLLSVGKENLYIFEMDESMMHENDAAEVLCSICRGAHMEASPVNEGKIELTAETDGLLKINRQALRKLNTMGEIVIASRFGDFPVKAGDKVAGMRVVPLVISREKMEEAKQAAGEEPVFSLLPFAKKKVGIVVTGNEVKTGRIEDKFSPVVVSKIAEYGGEPIGCQFPGDEKEEEVACIRSFIEQGADLVVCTGGMSVDPDDRTPFAIREASDRVISYGAPVLPGAMFMLGYRNVPAGDGSEAGQVPIVGLPGCVMYAKRTIFDLVLPRLMADDEITAEELGFLGEGGLCLGCRVCTFPNCGFGKGR